MVEVPAATPNTIPDGETVATPVLVLTHVPVPVSLNVVVTPLQAFRTPVIVAGNGFIVTGIDCSADAPPQGFVSV